MYHNDSFQTLNLLQQVGLVTLSLTLLGLTLWGTYCLTKNRHISLRLLISVIIFWLFLWLTPQIYYTYYQILWPDLPNQFVIQSPPSILDMLKLLTFQDKFATSEHAQGLLGWCALGVAGFRHKFRLSS